mmetsp:Transcript_69802/g.175830  ORF Transcript_69802/g.175830 Transcript_69802/m.175830 type:complete len:430 (-) Transcript_69802:104-1393(-)
MSRTPQALGDFVGYNQQGVHHPQHQHLSCHLSPLVKHLQDTRHILQSTLGCGQQGVYYPDHQNQKHRHPLTHLQPPDGKSVPRLLARGPRRPRNNLSQLSRPEPVLWPRLPPKHPATVSPSLSVRQTSPRSRAPTQTASPSLPRGPAAAPPGAARPLPRPWPLLSTQPPLPQLQPPSRPRHGHWLREPKRPPLPAAILPCAAAPHRAQPAIAPPASAPAQRLRPVFPRTPSQQLPSAFSRSQAGPASPRHACLPRRRKPSPLPLAHLQAATHLPQLRSCAAAPRAARAPPPMPPASRSQGLHPLPSMQPPWRQSRARRLPCVPPPPTAPFANLQHAARLGLRRQAPSPATVPRRPPCAPSPAPKRPASPPPVSPPLLCKLPPSPGAPSSRPPPATPSPPRGLRASQLRAARPPQLVLSPVCGARAGWPP